MKKYLIIFFTFTLSAFPFFGSKAQRNCGTEERQQYIEQFLPVEGRQTFESWLKKKQSESFLRGQAFRSMEETLIVPVVVHIIHNGEPVGVGSNISDEQVLSQIEVINEDFQRQNPDTVFTPPLFKPLAASLNLEFRLARRTPENLPTNGVVRVFSSKTNWSIFTEEYELKALSYWPAEDYLNIWVVNNIGGNFIAYATYPISNLPGIDDPNFNRLIDGIVVDHNFFGSSEKGNFPVLEAPLDQGRTLTHEIGHYLGLRHTWGDGDCNNDDFCADTPNTDDPTYDCPLGKIACDGITPAMIQNYMDYTDDRCMNLFTSCQKDRMMTVLLNSPRRLSLLSSDGAVPPDLLEYDLSLNSILYPNEVFTGNSVAPVIELTNTGSETLTNFSLEVSINGQGGILQVNNVTIDSAETIFYRLPQGLPVSEVNNLEIKILEIEGQLDLNLINNRYTKLFVANEVRDFIPYRETFDDLEQWLILNEDGQTSWNGRRAMEQDNAFIELYNYSNEGTTDWLVSPALDFSLVSQASMSFRYAHGSRRLSTDRLTVLLYTHGGDSLREVLFNNMGSILNTTNITDYFIPESRLHYEELYFDLSEYTGQTEVRVAFVTTNGGGNNLFLEDVQFYGESTPPSRLVEESDKVTLYPNPTRERKINLAFNLPERQSIQVKIVDTMGRLHYEGDFSNIINQNVSVELPALKHGVYIFKISGTNFSESVRVLVL